MSVDRTSSLAMMLPGQPIAGPSEIKTQAGTGTYRRNGFVVASLVGEAHKDDGRAHVATHPLSQRFAVPTAGDTVLGRVTRVTQRQANVSILVVNGRPCSSGDWSASGLANAAAGEDAAGAMDFTGLIRTQDVRQTDKDKVRMGDCFRPNDIVRARVVSLGDAKSFFLTTAANHLGVVHALPAIAQGALGGPHVMTTQAPLVPLNWQEMKDPVTGAVEKRKVAKPVDV